MLLQAIAEAGDALGGVEILAFVIEHDDAAVAPCHQQIHHLPAAAEAIAGDAVGGQAFGIGVQQQQRHAVTGERVEGGAGHATQHHQTIDAALAQERGRRTARRLQFEAAQQQMLAVGDEGLLEPLHDLGVEDVAEQPRTRRIEQQADGLAALQPELPALGVGRIAHAPADLQHPRPRIGPHPARVVERTRDGGDGTTGGLGDVVDADHGTATIWGGRTVPGVTFFLMGRRATGRGIHVRPDPDIHLPGGSRPTRHPRPAHR